MNRKGTKSAGRRTAQQTLSPALLSKSHDVQRPHIFLNDPNVQEIKRALSPFWAWRLER